MSLEPDTKKLEDWVFIWLPVILSAFCVVINTVSNITGSDYYSFLLFVLFLAAIGLIKFIYGIHHQHVDKFCDDVERSRRGRLHLISSLLMFLLLLIAGAL